MTMMIEALSALMLASGLVRAAAPPPPEQASAAQAAQSDEQAVIDKVYRPGTRAVDMCGLEGESFASFFAALRADPAFREENSNARYQVFNAREPGFRQIVVARERETAWPMAYCREVIEGEDGKVRLKSSMHCEGAKDDCDAEFVEFRNHDQQLLGAQES